jgi:excisionase family DNA binding protein
MNTSPKSSRKSVSAVPTDVLTIEEAAELLRCHPVTIRRNADALHIPYKRLGSLWRFSRIELEAWMRQQNSAAA